MDYRHPIQQIANSFIATYRDVTDGKQFDIGVLEYFINGALTEINAQGFEVLADSYGFPICEVRLSMVNEKVNVEFLAA